MCICLVSEEKVNSIKTYFLHANLLNLSTLTMSNKEYITEAQKLMNSFSSHFKSSIAFIAFSDGNYT